MDRDNPPDIETDFHVADVGAPEVEPKRTQTIVQFRYKLK